MKKPTITALVSQSIRSARVDLGVSQDEFADRIGMHRSYYGSIERGEKNITLTTLERVAAGLGTTMSALLKAVDPADRAMHDVVVELDLRIAEARELLVLDEIHLTCVQQNGLNDASASDLVDRQRRLLERLIAQRERVVADRSGLAQTAAGSDPQEG